MRRLGLATLMLAASPLLAFEPKSAGFEFNRALFLHYSQEHFSAASMALRMQRSAEDTSPQAARFIIDNLLAYGLYQEAVRRFRAELQAGQLSSEARADLWLKLARYEYERGYFDAAEATLTEMRVDVGGRRRRTERAGLLAQLQLRSGRPEAAVDTLLDGRVYAKDDFARYNLGMALIASGEVRRGRIELDKLGRQVVTDPVEHALRDRTNLALAYNYLAEAKGGSAMPVLRRIRLEGPYSDEALLGLGWAEIAADKADVLRLTDERRDDTIGGVIGDILRPGKVNDDIRARLGMLRTGSSADDEAQRFRNALVPWLELDGRDPKKPAVLEVQLAIPYALDALGEKDRARRFYQRAVERLEEGRSGLEKAIDGIQSGRMVETMIRRDRDRQAGWNWRLRDLPDAAETYYLAEILADSTFQEALKNYRDLKQLQRKLARDRQALIDSASGAHMASVPATELFRQRLQDSPPLWQQVRADLTLETQLGRYPRNETLEGLLAWTYRYAPKIPLKLATAHGEFTQAPSSDALALIARVEGLLEGVNALIGRQRDLLEKIAVSGLEEHKAMLTRYLIDARFALARLFDETQLPAEGDE